MKLIYWVFLFCSILLSFYAYRSELHSISIVNENMIVEAKVIGLPVLCAANSSIDVLIDSKIFSLNIGKYKCRNNKYHINDYVDVYFSPSLNEVVGMHNSKSLEWHFNVILLLPILSFFILFKEFRKKKPGKRGSYTFY